MRRIPTTNQQPYQHPYPTTNGYLSIYQGESRPNPHPSSPLKRERIKVRVPNCSGRVYSAHNYLSHRNPCCSLQPHGPCTNKIRTIRLNLFELKNFPNYLLNQCATICQCYFKNLHILSPFNSITKWIR